jgi:hypothetical protein
MVADPNISVNKLAEYIVSKAARQRKILADRKYPDPDFNIGMYYREAEEAVARYIADGAVDPDPIKKRVAALEQEAPTKVGTARRINSNIDALERFSEMLDDIDLTGVTPTLGAHAPPKLTYHGVAVSVRPQIILRGAGPKGKSMVGGLKLHFSTTRPHSEESAGYVSAAVQEFCRLHVAAANEIVNPSYCAVIDVASGNVYQGVKSTTQRLKDIAAECQNIAALWPTI